MSSFRVGGTLSSRLAKLSSYSINQSIIWDIGCDHGDLGLSFLNSPQVKEIHLVDPSLKVVNVLKEKLKDSYITVPKVLIEQKKGQEIKIESENNVFFIAGMGGKEIRHIVEHLLKFINDSSIIVLSPHKNILELREFLHHSSVSLMDEDLVFENEHFYQVLALRPNQSIIRNKVSIFGDLIWKSPLAYKYKEHLLTNFKHHRGDQSKDFVSFLNSIHFDYKSK